jgi:hypothetical protein
VYVLKYFRIRCLLTAIVNRNSSAPGGRPSLAAQSLSAMMISSLLTVFLQVGPHSRAAFARQWAKSKEPGLAISAITVSVGEGSFFVFRSLP